MNKILTICLIMVSSYACYAQKTDTLKNSIQKEAEAIGQGGNNEIKINLLFTVLGVPEVTYERLLADNMGVGASVLVALDRTFDYKFAFVPYYRIYFGAKKASGFFIEGNASLITFQDYDYYYNASTYPSGYKTGSTSSTATSLGLGAAAGAKFLTRNGFLGEVYLGGGRTFGKDSGSNLSGYARIGITIGKRF